jgi:RHS repeat-associated protein
VIQDLLNQDVYDPEGRLCAVEVKLLTTATQYVYDAEGQRVAKGTLSSWPATGATCAAPTSPNFTLSNQYLTGVAQTELNGSGAWLHSNLSANGTLVNYASTTSAVYFQLTDPLGTRRIMADATGKVQQTCQSLPFGNGESCPPTPTEQLFTGKERDTESGNDYFGARYYASSMGRWMSPDWAAKAEPVPYAKLDFPQSLNLYAYVLNNPMTRFDADGHDFWDKVLNAVQGKGWKDTPRPPLAQPAAPGGPPMKGVNPVTGKTLFSPTPKGQPGNERLGAVDGAGNFGAHRNNATGTPHQGEDISAPDGADIHAATSGTVTFSGTQTGYGNTVKIDDGSGTVTLYAHNSDNGVSVGDTVKQGDVIGSVGQTGNAAGQPASEEHLHFGVYVNGQAVDPANWLNSATNP